MRIRISELRRVIRESLIERITQDVEKKLDVFRRFTGQMVAPGSPEEYRMYKDILNLLMSMDVNDMTPDMRKWREDRLKEVARIHASANKTRSQRDLPPVKL